MDFRHAVVVSTVDSEESALAIADSVVGARLGACAQVVGPITSVYRWQGALRRDREWRLEIKTSADRVAALIAHLDGVHDYEVPEIVVLPIVDGGAGYLSWLTTETREE